MGSLIARVRRVGLASAAAVLSLGLAGGSLAASASPRTPAARHPSAAGANVAAAKALLAKYSHPSPFPVTVPLKRRPVGAHIAVMSCGTSVCGLLYALMQPAAKLMGVQLKEYMAGPTVSAVPTAFSAMMNSKPDGVIILPTNPLLIKPYLSQLKAKHIPVATGGMPWTNAERKKFGIGAQQSGQPFAFLGGELQAAWVVAHYGAKANVLIENIPDLVFSPSLVATFKSEMRKLCSACKVSELDIPIQTMGTTDTSQEVAYLQAHPGINVVATASGETFYGVPSALAAAGIHVALIDNAPAPENLADIQSGQETMGVGADFPNLSFTMIDAMARMITHQPVTPDEASGAVVEEVLTKANLKGNVSKGWVGYPDFVTRFAKLWGVKA